MLGDEASPSFEEERLVRKGRYRNGQGHRAEPGRSRRSLRQRDQGGERGERALGRERSNAVRIVGGGNGFVQIAGSKPGAPLVGPELHVVGRVEALDLVRFEQGCLEDARGLDERNLVNLGEHLEPALGGTAPRSKMARHSLPQARRLADVDDIAVAAQEAIDARAIRHRSTPIERERVHPLLGATEG